MIDVPGRKVRLDPNHVDQVFIVIGHVVPNADMESQVFIQMVFISHRDVKDRSGGCSLLQEIIASQGAVYGGGSYKSGRVGPQFVVDAFAAKILGCQGKQGTTESDVQTR